MTQYNDLQQIQAAHLDGGNLYDHILLDINESHSRFDKVSFPKHPLCQSALRNNLRFHIHHWLQKSGWGETLVSCAIKSTWFHEFSRYWREVLCGRPLFMQQDFFQLVHEYRKKQLPATQLNWGDDNRHIEIWQRPEGFYYILHAARKFALQPIPFPFFWKKIIKPKQKILEYGCSHAPYYYCYRQFFGHYHCHWTLADLPNFPFHYGKYLYRNDEQLETVTLSADTFNNPLKNTSSFDVILLTTVLEHVPDPLFLLQYLVDKLNPNGLLVFDFIKSDGKGLDHPQACVKRTESLEWLRNNSTTIYGNIDIEETTQMTIIRKTTL